MAVGAPESPFSRTLASNEVSFHFKVAVRIPSSEKPIEFSVIPFRVNLFSTLAIEVVEDLTERTRDSA
jgi:hypothetical protein